MKKVILASVVAIAAVSSVTAEAATVSYCGGSSAISFSVSAGGATDFVKSQFVGRCSNNVYLVGDDNGTYYRVGAASGKGKQAFGASTNGGGVTGVNCSTPTQCGLGDASAAATSAASS